MKTEAQIQSECVIAFRNKITLINGSLMVEVENKTDSAKHGVKRKAMGLVKGFPDTIIIAKDNVFFVEFKTIKGRQSTSQQTIQKILETLGFKYYVCRSTEQFNEIILNEINIQI